jgi:uncharacterized protein (DUF362 family)
MSMQVIVERVSSNEDIINLLKFSVDKLDQNQKLKIARNIVIKPNLCCSKSSSSGATTDVSIVNSLLEVLNEINPSANICIIESNSHALKADEAFKIHGYLELVDKYSNVKLVNISRDKKYSIDVNGFVLANLMMPETLLNMDYFISIAKLKTHIFERMSCVMKNQFGCLTRTYKSGFHPFMSKVLTDLNLLYKPDLCVIDGIPGMDGFGPTDGFPVYTGLFIIGNDPVATDTVAAKLMGFNPRSVPHLKFAMKHGESELKDLQIIGEKLESLNFQFVPRTAYWTSRLALRIQGFGYYLLNLGNLIEKIRSATLTVGVSYVRKKVTYGFAISNIKNWIFKRDG